MSLISDGELRRQLQGFGMDVGPITNATRNLYQKKLRSLRSQKQRNASPARPRVTAGVKRKNYHLEGANQEENLNKKPKMDPGNNERIPGLNHINSPSKLYPDLSEMLPTPRTTQDSPTSSTPIKNAPFIDGGSGSPIPQANFSSHSFPPRYGVPSDEESSSSFTLSQESEVKEDYPSTLVSPPSPQSLSESSSLSSSPSCAEFSPKPKERSGFFQTVTKFLGSQVSQLFGKPEPRRSLSSPFSSPSRRLNVASPSNRGGTRRLPVHSSKPVNLSDSNIKFRDEMAEHPVPPVGDLSASSPPPSRYDWELEPAEVSLCRRPDGSLWRLGKGGFGEVFKGLRDGVDEVAIKIIQLHSCSPKTIMQFKSEIDLISKLRHRNIVQFYGACIRPQNLYMVTELMSNDLFSVLRLPREAERYKWSGIYGREVLVGVAVGLNYLHSRRPPVVHRDIKSPNILVMDGLSKIADVGVARTMGASDMTAQRGFTVAWAAPEVVYRRRATEKIDIWSFGIIVWEVVTGKLPRPGKLTLPSESSSPSLKSLYSRCINDNPTHRPTSLEIVNEFKNIH